MMKTTYILIILIITNTVLAQNYITKFPNQDSTKTYSNSVILGDSQKNLLLFYHEGDSLFFSKSSDGGNTWIGKHFVLKNDTEEGSFPFDGISTKDGKMMLLANKNRLYYSSDDGQSWSENYDIKVTHISDAPICYINDSTYWVMLPGLNTFFYTNDTGKTWQRSAFEFRQTRPIDPSATSINDSTVLIVSTNYQSGNGHSRIVGWFTDNFGQKLVERFIIVDSEHDDYDPKLVKFNNRYIIVYSTSIERRAENNPVALKYISSEDGLSWSDPKDLTSYLGQNLQHSMNKINDDVWITFKSNRFNRDQIWYTKFEDVEDPITPPYLQELIKLTF